MNKLKAKGQQQQKKQNKTKNKQANKMAQFAINPKKINILRGHMSAMTSQLVKVCNFCTPEICIPLFLSE